MYDDPYSCVYVPYHHEISFGRNSISVPLALTMSNKHFSVATSFEMTVLSLSLLVEVFVYQRPKPLFMTPIMKADPQLIMSLVCTQAQQRLHCPPCRLWWPCRIASLSAVPLGIKPGFGGFNQTVLAVVGTEGQDTQSCLGR